MELPYNYIDGESDQLTHCHNIPSSPLYLTSSSDSPFSYGSPNVQVTTPFGFTDRVVDPNLESPLDSQLSYNHRARLHTNNHRGSNWPPHASAEGIGAVSHSRIPYAMDQGSTRGSVLADIHHPLQNSANLSILSDFYPSESTSQGFQNTEYLSSNSYSPHTYSEGGLSGGPNVPWVQSNQDNLFPPEHMYTGQVPIVCNPLRMQNLNQSQEPRG
jgi:hypothetical protein